MSHLPQLDKNLFHNDVELAITFWQTIKISFTQDHPNDPGLNNMQPITVTLLLKIKVQI